MRLFHALETGDGETLEFEWDDAKALENRRKHRLSFEEAATIFLADVLTIEDAAAYGEMREISFGVLGQSPEALVVICVVHTERNGRTRIISARKATPHERKEFNVHYGKTTH
ncbi:BrnT family toxin [Propylenella binzhouense]|uniref:BrnT family toxin n=1 Tax=Propylenella binzhouense TaxID=2555902 RepID=A0A964T6K4_9HYPH|nr:BrnT family toxin [Propylenella binzhouense]MYZ48342.1 BrnT family toxin [Propylenella binzhouense]